MRAFVTGSTGLLGNNLVRTLVGAGYEVLALARSKEKAQRQLGDTPARVVLGDMQDVAGFAGALDGVDVLFHTAAYFREYYTPGDHAAMIDLLNVKATMELAQAAQSRGVKKMVDTSSSGIIGLKPDGSPGDEETPMWPGARKNLYFDSKRKVEPLLRAFAKEKGFFIASALPAWMWGPHDAAPTPSGQIVLDAFAGKLPPAIPPGGSSVVDARDVAVGMLRIAQTGRSGERYILGGAFASLGEIVASLGALAGTNPPTIGIPYAGALAFAAISETWSRITRKPSAISVAAIRLMNARLTVTSAKAQRELGATFRPFAATLADTVAWIKANLADKSSPAASAVAGSTRQTA
jgi:dihydroflavonol-4-reductase